VPQLAKRVCIEEGWIVCVLASLVLSIIDGSRQLNKASR